MRYDKGEPRLKKSALVFSVILNALLLGVAYLLQGLVLPYMRVFGLVPLLLPIVATGSAVFEGRVAGGVTGLAAGILCDLSYAQPVAAFAVLLTATGLIAGFVADTIMARGFPTFFFCSVAVLILASFMQMFPLMFFEGIPPGELLLTGGAQIVYSLVFTLPLYFFVRPLGRVHRGV